MANDDLDVLIKGFFKGLHELARKSEEGGHKTEGQLYGYVCNMYQQRGQQNIGESTFYNKLNPDHEGRMLDVELFINILLVLPKAEQRRMLDSFLVIFGYQSKAKKPTEKEASYEKLVQAWMDFDKEHGDVQEELRSALHDKKINKDELKKIEKELSAQITKMDDLRSVIQVKKYQ